MRGTSNSNDRGSSYDRRRRKLWLLETFDPVLGPSSVWCAECREVILSHETIEVGRIIPGARGGRYTRDNIRPVCRPCNNALGHRTQQEIHAETCRGQCWRCQVTQEYRALRHAAEIQRESATSGYATEVALYGGLMTFKEYLVARRTSA